MGKKITVEIDLTNDWADHTDQEEDDMYELCEQGLADSILGEQFYISRLGKKYLASV